MFVAIVTVNNYYMPPASIRTHRQIFIALLAMVVSSLSAQTTVTLTDGQFIYRLSVKELPGVHYKQNTPKRPGVNNKNQLPEIGVMTGTVTSITILNAKDTTRKQVIIPGKNETVWPWTNTNKEERFIMQDMNFDGYNDIRLLNNTDKFTYYCWIYQPATGQFAEDTTLTKFVNPQFDQEQKLVYRNIDLPGDKKTQLYQYINGKLTLIEEDEISSSDTAKTSAVTIRKLMDGKLQEVRKVQIPKN